jgi:hypothetical protein
MFKFPIVLTLAQSSDEKQSETPTALPVMLIPSCKYPDISSWDAGLLPHCVLPVGILEYPVYTLGVPIVVLSFVGSDL